MEITIINNKERMQKVAKRLDVRDDWHEPDEEGVTVEVFGNRFDNAFGCCEPDKNGNGEYFVMLYRNKLPIAAVNLATLFALASE